MSDKILTGCANGSCRITGTRKGLHTNGGCKCIDNALWRVVDDVASAGDEEYANRDKLRRELESLLLTLWTRVEKAEANLRLRRDDGL